MTERAELPTTALITRLRGRHKKRRYDYSAWLDAMGTTALTHRSHTDLRNLNWRNTENTKKDDSRHGKTHQERKMSFARAFLVAAVEVAVVGGCRGRFPAPGGSARRLAAARPTGPGRGGHCVPRIPPLDTPRDPLLGSRIETRVRQHQNASRSPRPRHAGALVRSGSPAGLGKTPPHPSRSLRACTGRAASPPLGFTALVLRLAKLLLVVDDVVL
ncbi:hypothetical protein MTO96_008924 [Rhipicephalus appendiculatus]